MTSMYTRVTLHRVKGEMGAAPRSKTGRPECEWYDPAHPKSTKLAAEGSCICTARLLEGKDVANLHALLTDPLNVYTALLNSSSFFQKIRRLP